MLQVEADTATANRLAVELFELLDEHDIVYCHWKSNELIPDGIVGDTDLDLLVDRHSFSAAISLILNCGFKRANVRWGPRTHGVLHFYGYDREANGLIHVHLYARVLTGESLVKSHVLPCDRLLLSGNERLHQVRVPRLKAEAAVAVMRHFIKNGSLLHVLLHGRSHGRNERDQVLFPDDEDAALAAYKVLSEHYQALDRQLFLQCYRSIVNDESAIKQWWLGRQVRRAVSGCACYTTMGRLRAYAGLLVAKLRRLASGKVKNKVLDSGGAVIAFIGGDATGKSTLVKETSRWLGTHLAIRQLHIGKPPAGWVTFPITVLLPFARKLFPHQRHQSQQALETVGPPDQEGKAPSASMLYALRAVALAWDRAQLVKRAHRCAAAGEIIICDRYPADRPGATDGPRLQRQVDGKSWRVQLFNWLVRVEHKLYRRNSPPDLALCLHVSIETAKQRNRTRQKSDRHSDENLELRHSPRRSWEKRGTKELCDIDTEMSLSDTIHSVKTAIWRFL